MYTGKKNAESKVILNCKQENKKIKGLGCLPRSACFRSQARPSFARLQAGQDQRDPEQTARGRMISNVWLETLTIHLNVPHASFPISIAPKWYTFFTMNGPDHRDFNFPGKRSQTRIKQENKITFFEFARHDTLIMNLLWSFLCKSSHSHKSVVAFPPIRASRGCASPQLHACPC